METLIDARKPFLYEVNEGEGISGRKS